MNVLGLINEIKKMSVHNWEHIANSKTEKELIELLSNNNFIDFEAKYYYIKELELRKYDTNKLDSFKKSFVNECINLKSNLAKTSFKEYRLKIESYLIIAMSLYFFLNLLKSFNFSFNNLWFVGTLFFSIGGAIILYVSRLQLKRILKEKAWKNELIDKFIANINCTL